MLTIQQAQHAYLIARKANADAKGEWKDAWAAAARLEDITRRTEEAEAATRAQLLAAIEASGSGPKQPSFRIITDVSESKFAVQESTENGWVTRTVADLAEANRLYELALINGGWDVVVKQADVTDRYSFTTDKCR